MTDARGERRRRTQHSGRSTSRRKLSGFRTPRTASFADRGDTLVHEWSASGRRSARATQCALCAHVRMQRVWRSSFAQRLDIRQGNRQRRHLAQVVKRTDHTVVAVMRRCRRIWLLARLRTVGMVVAAMRTASGFGMRMGASGGEVQRIAGHHHRCVGDGRENGRRLSDRKAHHALGRQNASSNSDPTRQSSARLCRAAADESSKCPRILQFGCHSSGRPHSDDSRRTRRHRWQQPE